MLVPHAGYLVLPSRRCLDACLLFKMKRLCQRNQQTTEQILWMSVMITVEIYYFMDKFYLNKTLTVRPKFQKNPPLERVPNPSKFCACEFVPDTEERLLNDQTRRWH